VPHPERMDGRIIGLGPTEKSIRVESGIQMNVLLGAAHRRASGNEQNRLRSFAAGDRPGREQTQPLGKLADSPE